jgi:hypothetical protein
MALLLALLTPMTHLRLHAGSGVALGGSVVVVLQLLVAARV